MADVAAVAQRHYRTQALIGRSIVTRLLALWAVVDAADIDGTWRAQLERAAPLLALGQYAAAGASTEYIRDAAAAQGVDPDLTGVTDARSFAGVAADGRDLVTLLGLAAVYAKAGIAAGLDTGSAMGRGAAWLTLAGGNEVAQASRNADHVALTSARGLRGYVRMLNPPSCNRCVILAGKWFEWNQGFARHPHCDCVHIPAANTSPVAPRAISPRDYFDSLTTAEQDATFGASDAAAIRGGADMARLVNVGTRGARRAQGLAEFDPTSRSPLTALYRSAGGDRARAVELLTQHGYLNAA